MRTAPGSAYLHYSDADPDPTFNFDRDPDPTFHFEGVRQTFNIYAAPDPDPLHHQRNVNNKFFFNCR
jgi:hypothetical protein